MMFLGMVQELRKKIPNEYKKYNKNSRFNKEKFYIYYLTYNNTHVFEESWVLLQDFIIV